MHTLSYHKSAWGRRFLLVSWWLWWCGEMSYYKVLVWESVFMSSFGLWILADEHAYTLASIRRAPLWGHFSYCFSHQLSHSSKHILAFASLSCTKWFFMICMDRGIVFPLWIGWLNALLCSGSILCFADVVRPFKKITGCYTLFKKLLNCVNCST